MKNTFLNRLSIFFCVGIVVLGASKFADFLCSVIYSIASVRLTGLDEWLTISTLLFVSGIASRTYKGNEDSEYAFVACLIGLIAIVLGAFGSVIYGLLL